MPYEFHLKMTPRVVSTLPVALNLGFAPTHDATLTIVRDFLSGTGVDQIDCIHAKRHTILTGATEAVDLSGGANDAFGTAFPMVTLCGLILINQDYDGTVNTTNLTIGGGANAANILGNTTVTKTIRPGQMFMDINGGAGGIATITPGTADIFQIVNAAGATNNCQLIFFGRST